MSISASNYLMVSRVQNRRAPRSAMQAQYSLRKWTAALVLLIALALGVMALSNQAAVATDSPAHVAISFITVQPGQSLWSIAERVAPQTDPRKWIGSVMTLNAMKAADVVAGQRLVLPQK